MRDYEQDVAVFGGGARVTWCVVYMLSLGVWCICCACILIRHIRHTLYTPCLPWCILIRHIRHASLGLVCRVDASAHGVRTSHFTRD